MNQYSEEVLQRALLIIDNYKKKCISLGDLVNSLEGSLTALEEKMSADFYESWYSYWGDLETILAIGNESQAQKYVFEDLEGLERIIKKQLS